MRLPAPAASGATFGGLTEIKDRLEAPTNADVENPGGHVVMPSKTKTQLKAELEETKQELQELNKRANAEAESQKEVEKLLRAELEELRLRFEARDRSKSAVHVKDDPEFYERKTRFSTGYRLSDSRSRRSETPVDTADAGILQDASSILRQVMQVRDETLEAVDRTHWELDKMEREMQQFMKGTLESMISELKKEFQQEATRNSGGIATLLGGGSERDKTAVTASLQPDRESENSESTKSYQKPMKLPPLPSFHGESREDVDALNRWLAKLESMQS